MDIATDLKGHASYMSSGGVVMRQTTADLCVKASDEIIRLMGIIDKIDATIFAIGAPLGSDEYFQIRALCNSTPKPTNIE
jgi:hypothetical protein